jgi:general stress protein 26
LSTSDERGGRKEETVVSERQNDRQKIYNMLEGMESAMLVTRSTTGLLEARPMRIAEVEPAGPLWFLTSRTSRKVDEVAQDPQVLLVCQDASGQYLSVAGTARVVDEPLRTRRLWKEPYKVWFPGGPDDPEIVLVSVEPEIAEFWDVSGVNRLRYLFEAAKAYVTGDRVRIEDSESHGRIRV